MNAEQVARILGISSKTVLRYIARGTITATRKNAQELSITDDQVEILRQVLILEKSRHLSGISLDTSGQMSALEQRVAELESLVASQEDQIIDAACRISTLELTNFLASTLENIPSQPVQSKPINETLPKEKPQISRSEPNIPDDWTLCSDFFNELGIKETTWRRYLTNGLAGEFFEFEEKPRVGTTQKYRYFTHEQKQKALDMLKRHGKLPDI